MERHYTDKNGNTYRATVATTKERIAKVKASAHGIVIEGDKMIVCYNTTFYPAALGLTKVSQ